MNKSTLWNASKYLLAFGVLFFVIYANWEPTDDRPGLRDVRDRPINQVYLLLALAFQALSMIAMLFRWYILVRAQDMPFTIFAALRLGTLGFICSAFLPGSVGGDLIRATALAREQSRQTIAVATVVMDRALSLWGLIFVVAVVGSACWAFDLLDNAALGASHPIIVTACIIVSVTSAAWLAMGLCSPEKSEQLADKLSRTPKIGGSLSQLWQAVWLFRRRPVSVAWAIFLTTLSNVFDILAFNCYALTLWDGVATNPLPGLSEHFLLVPIGLVISGVPLFPGGAGIGEAGFGGLYELFGSAPANGVLGSLLFRVSGWGLGIVGFLCCLATETTAKPKE